MSAQVREFVARICATAPGSPEARAIYREAALAGLAREVTDELCRRGAATIAEGNALLAEGTERSGLRVVK